MALFVLHLFPTFATGGAQTRTLRLVDALGEGFEHGVLPLDGCGTALESVTRHGAAARLERLPAIPRAGSLRTARWLQGVIEERAPALLCTYNWGAIDGLLALEAFGAGANGTRPRAVLHHEEGVGPEEAHRPLRRRTWARRALLRGVDRVIVPSSVLHRRAIDDWRVPAERVAWIPNGVRLDAPVDSDAGDGIRRELGISAGAGLIGFVGPLRPEKNPCRLVEVLARLSDGEHLVVVGEGPERGAILARAEALRVTERVHLVGHRSDPTPWLRALDVYLVTSDTEQLPMALLEAMAQGRSVVTLDVGDVARALPPVQRDQVVGPGEDPVAGLARRVRALLADADERARLGHANRERVASEFAFDTMVERYRACYALAER